MKKTIIIIFAALLALCSCTKKADEGTHNTYIRIESGEVDYNVSFIGGTMSYMVYSDYDRWEFKVNMSVDAEQQWVKVWPGDVEKCARFSVKVFPNTNPEPRTATIDFVCAGKVIQTININQGGQE